MFKAEEFKCRASAFNKMCSKSLSNPVLTEKQTARMGELEAKETLTDKMKEELADLQVKKENGNKVILSDTCIEYLMEYYSWATVQKVSVTKEFQLDFCEKGTIVEPDSIKLLSLIDEIEYTKNEGRISNEFFSGEPDIFTGPDIMKAERVVDIKSVWDYPGFLKKINVPLIPAYKDQVRVYGDISTSTDLSAAYCLVDTNERLIQDYKKRLLYKMDVISEESPEYVLAADKLVHSMTFNDIPGHKRVFKVAIEPFTDFERQRGYDQVKKCREWLFNFHEKYEELNM